MLIFILDDEPLVLEDTRTVVAQAAPEAELRVFSLASQALEAISEQGLRPDVVFSDIEMPGFSGLELAARLKTLSPDTRIVFVTGYPDYAVRAFKLKVHGFLLKPLSVEDVREELSWLPKPPEAEPGKLRVRCFGNFEVFWQNKPLVFERNKTKELFACLVDREGAWCTAGEIISVLWENPAEIKDVKHYLRILIGDLTATLKRIEMQDVLLRKRGQWAVERRLLDCDYYRMADGDIDAVNAFRGQYMAQYSWAELTTGHLVFLERTP